MLNAPETFGTSKDQPGDLHAIKSGKTVDLIIIGSLLYFAVVLFANFKLLFDSNNLTYVTIGVNLLSSASYLAIFYAFSQEQDSQLHLMFQYILHYP